MRKKWLPENVSEYRDRHGKKRYRFRKKGLPSREMRFVPGTAEFMSEYREACQAAGAPAAPRAKAGTFDALCESFYQTPGWTGMAANSRKTYGGVIERFRESKTKRGERRGDLPVASMTTKALDSIFADMADRPGAANMLRKTLKRLLKHAVKIELIDSNPALATDRYKTGPGLHTWTDEEIEQYRAHWAYGTKARLAMELALNTAARRCNVAALERAMLRNGKFHIEHVKGCDPTIVRASSEALLAIEAMGVTGIGHFLVTAHGKAFSVAGFGNKFRDWCNAAGLPQCSLHGLRKAQSRRLAEAGATVLEGRAVTGHKTDATFAYYAEKANREVLADAAMTNLENRFGNEKE